MTSFMGKIGLLRIYKKMGAPIKGPVKRKNSSPSEKYIFFSLVLSLSFQHSLALLSPFFASVISFLSVPGQYFTDPHQSPIRIKAGVL
jgi:hypothetical protein